MLPPSAVPVAGHLARFAVCAVVLTVAVQLGSPATARAEDALAARVSGLHEGMMPTDSPDAAIPGLVGVSTAPNVSVASTIPVGPDVASYQHPGGAAINWGQVAASGQTFAIVKATEMYTGSDGQPHLYTNPYLKGDLDGAHAAGLVVGAYAFAHPENSATAQADAFATAIGTLPAGSLPPVLDLEVTGGLGVGQLVGWTQAFLDRLQLDTGIVPMIYTGPSFWSTNLGGSTAFSRYPLWEAHYTAAPAPAPVGGWSTYNLWQFTSSATIPGIPGTTVDQSRFNGAAPATLAVRTMPSTLTAPATLTAGQYLISGHQQYRLVLQSDGNLVQYGNGAALWSSGTWGHPGAYASLQSDGNLVVYAPGGAALWSTGTWTSGAGASLTVQASGDAQIVLPGNRVVWHDGAPGPDRVRAPATLLAGDQITSPNGQYHLDMQGDGNLVVYGNGRPLWSSGTSGHPGATTALQVDGNLVVYDGGGVPLWSSGTWGTGPGGWLAMQDDGDLTLTPPNGVPVWRTRAPGADSLTSSSVLRAGQFLHDAPGADFALQQSDGNLVVYRYGRATWSSHTWGNPGAWTVLQSDGNLVVYAASGAPLWSSRTWGTGSSNVLTMQTDGNLVVYNAVRAVWNAAGF